MTGRVRYRLLGLAGLTGAAAGQSAVGKAPLQTTFLLRCTPMTEAHLAEVHAMETSAHAFPWSSGNFLDSLAAGYDAWVIHAEGLDGQPDILLAYGLLMRTPDDIHLLNITVHPAWQGRGLGRVVLEELAHRCIGAGDTAMLLEVRPGNAAALALYRLLGFTLVGKRRGYYPSWGGTREDALVMRAPLPLPAPERPPGPHPWRWAAAEAPSPEPTPGLSRS